MSYEYTICELWINQLTNQKFTSSVCSGIVQYFGAVVHFTVDLDFCTVQQDNKSYFLMVKIIMRGFYETRALSIVCLVKHHFMCMSLTKYIVHTVDSSRMADSLIFSLIPQVVVVLASEMSGGFKSGPIIENLDSTL